MIAFAVIGILSLLARPALAICPDPLDVAKGSAHMPRAAPNRASDEAPVERLYEQSVATLVTAQQPQGGKQQS
ncbi:hypothetical protein CF327_g6947 [Tilletia walkeri]|nr:hypothetical protein CF327_g6947 [Tilletia walkeri]